MGGEAELAVFGAAYTCSGFFRRLFGGTDRTVQPIISGSNGAVRPDRILQALRLVLMT